MFARQNSRVILAHLLCWQGFGICQYAGTLAALHLHQTDAMQYSGSTSPREQIFLFFFVPFWCAKLSLGNSSRMKGAYHVNRSLDM